MHRTVSTLLFAACTLGAASLAHAATWEIDPAHTSVQFSVRHLMISNVRGEFGKVSGTIVGDAASPTDARIAVTIDAASIDTRNEKRDEHLRSPDFLDTAEFPTLSFTSTDIAKAGEGKWKVTGDLTLHGVTRPVVLDVETPAVPIKDPWGNPRAGAHATATIDRRDFGITYSKLLEGGGLMVGNEVAITIDVEVVQRAAAK